MLVIKYFSYSISGIEAIFLVLALNMIVNDKLHYIILILGLFAPTILVVSTLGFSYLGDFGVYLRTYTSQGKLIPSLDYVAMLDTIKEGWRMMCWIHPDYILTILHVPVASVLLFNTTVMITAVIAAYRSASYRFISKIYIYI